MGFNYINSEPQNETWRHIIMAVPNIEEYIESIKQNIFYEMTNLIFRIGGTE